MSSSKTIYFPGLNGIRAMAAMAVVISHTTLALTQFNLSPFIFGEFEDGNPKGLDLAGYGVSMFFVLSGFLITYLLKVEKDNQEIDVRKFYFRRILRIWPLYYTYLLFVIILMAMNGLNFNIKSFFCYLFFASNVPFILGTTLPFLGHYWSLGVEEQFYLFWPWIIKKVKKIISFISILIIILISLKIVLHVFYPNSILEQALHVTRFHCMMIGGLGAILFRNGNKLFLSIIDNKISQSFCWSIILLVVINKFHFFSIIDNELISVVTLFIIIGQINLKNRIINLELNLFDFLGKISFGIYVIHPMVIFFLSKIYVKLETYDIINYFLIYSIVLFITITISYFSYHYFEKIFLKFKRRYIVISSVASKDNL